MYLYLHSFILFVSESWSWSRVPDLKTSTKVKEKKGFLTLGVVRS